MFSPDRSLEDSAEADSSVSGLPSVAFHTLGCKTNQLETSAIGEQFKMRGWEIVPFEEAASFYVINTCTVTEKSDQESRRIIRRARLSNPQAKVIVTGCYAQVAPEELAAQPGVHYVIGNQFKDRIPQIIEENPFQNTPILKVSDIDKSRIIEGASASGIGRTRASLKIQDGCDYKCTYCIIWQARGPSRSLPVKDLERSTRELLEQGYREIVLTGINIGQYADQQSDLSDLLAFLSRISGSFRLRLTSLDPMEVTDRLIDTVAHSQGKIAPHFHLSAQSVDDGVLKRMARRHHVRDFQKVCQRIAAKIPHGSIGCDIIVGFPGETDERFERTYQALADLPIHYLHVFRYSKRKGTPAADFDEQVPNEVKRQRVRRLIDLAKSKNLAFRQQFLGQSLTILLEEDLTQGMSENYIKVTLEATQEGMDSSLQPNDLVEVQIISVTQEQTLGRWVRKINDDRIEDGSTLSALD